MERIINGNTYEFDCRLGTTIKIRKQFKMNFNDVIQKLMQFNEEQLIDFLYQGLDESKYEKDNFFNDILEDLGYMELYELVTDFIQEIQYPGKTEEEIDKLIMEKNQRASALKISSKS